MYPEDEYLALSGIQHIAFCRRQWALIHIEKRWAENYLTATGQLNHQRAHNEEIRERRGNLLVVRGLFVRSSELGLSGICDVVEFHQTNEGVSLACEKGLWLPVPVEYKRGKSKLSECDRLQVCAQAICLEEMFACKIPSGFLFYKQTQSRERVEFSEELRSQVKQYALEMHRLYKKKYIPKTKKQKQCNACSLIDECAPSLQTRSTYSYIQEMLEGER